jgi:hypothetical protein
MTSSQLAVLPDAAETSALTRWEALAADVAIASDQAKEKQFDYRDKRENIRARSWVAQLRKLKGAIERARKEAKAVHLERGRAVDDAAKQLEKSVQGLIEPHERELTALEAEEQDRIHAHTAVLERITALAEGVTTSADAQARIDELMAIDFTTLEEFTVTAAELHGKAFEQLQELCGTLRIQEQERAGLERLRAESAAREEAERLERLRQQAIAEERVRQEAEQRRAAEASAQREAQAMAAAEAARLAQQQAEQRAAAAEQQAKAARDAEAARAAEAAQAAARAEEARLKRAADLEMAICAAMAQMTREQVAAAIVSGALHPAVCVDWSCA